ncbi:hypothetical protein BGAL_0145g00070 [Botrytis galanthina]|uniref:Uncharacterized protein n=1 Tax=Botrytis galanthina TaxID=278940 RepID=A0A4S8QZS3_9HELO|nr:hypothetical protein BGAL_0145g00070 [Botrytis galanthina]
MIEAKTDWRPMGTGRLTTWYQCSLAYTGLVYFFPRPADPSVWYMNYKLSREWLPHSILSSNKGQNIRHNNSRHLTKSTICGEGPLQIALAHVWNLRLVDPSELFWSKPRKRPSVERGTRWIDADDQDSCIRAASINTFIQLDMIVKRLG